MRKAAGLLFFSLIAMSLSSCMFPIPRTAASDSQEMIGQYLTVSVLLTETARVTPPFEPGDTSISTPTPARIGTSTPASQAATPSAPETIENGAGMCDLARAGNPIDVTIPDDTRVRPGELFSKTWRLVNAGTCAWSRDYAVVWFSGDEMGMTHIQRMNGMVAPGQTIDVIVDMQAPKTPGIYQSNWKMMNDQGRTFGIGPEGSAPFWVRINVVPVVTETPTVTPQPPTATATPVVFISGQVELPVDAGLDLDSGEVNQVVRDDLRLEMDDQGRAQLQTENGARIVTFSQEMPDFTDCSTAASAATPVEMDQIQPGSYVCFRTSEGLPGWVVFSQFDPKKQQVTLEFVLWAVP